MTVGPMRQNRPLTEFSSSQCSNPTSPHLPDPTPRRSQGRKKPKRCFLLSRNREVPPRIKRSQDRLLAPCRTLDVTLSRRAVKELWVRTRKTRDSPKTSLRTINSKISHSCATLPNQWMRRLNIRATAKCLSI